MELSEFTPPSRQSMTDEEISQKLGSASADEAGMLAAMEFLETQTNLREQDNAAVAAWVAKMNASEDPRAKVAVENFERAKLGLTPLPLEQPVGSAEENAEAFEEMIQESQEVIPEPAEAIEDTAETTLETVAEEIAPEEFETSVETHKSLEKPVTGYRMVSAANWIIGIGVFAPALAAVLANLFGMNFVTSVLAGLVGILAGVKVNVIGLLTARRTHRGLAVASRSTFGVFGSIVPGIALVLSGLFALAVIAFGAAIYLDGRIQGIDLPFAEKLLTLGSVGSLTLGGLVAIGFVLVAGVLAIFGGKFARFVKISLASLTLGGFLVVAFATTSNINFLNLAGVFQLESFLIGAPLFALAVSILTYGLDGESLSIASWGASRKRLTWPVLVFGFILPMLSYSHVAALLNTMPRGLKSSGQTTIDFLLETGGPIVGTVMLDLAIVSVIGLLYLGLMKVIEALKTLGTNHVGYGSAILLISVFIVLVIALSLFVAEPLSLSLALAAIAVVPAAAWLGAVLTESLMRRGSYHDASLTRSYGFYGSFNWIAVSVFVGSTVVGYGFSQPFGVDSWFGFLTVSTGFSVPFAIGSLLAMGTAAVLTLLTSFPSISRQQRETKAVEERKFDLVDVVVE
jgi:hypothetical protein